MPSDTRPRRFGDRSIAALGVAVVVAAFMVTRGPSATASSPILEVHTAAGGVVVDSPTISVTGQGRVMGTPNTLTVGMGVTSTAAHASDALSQNNQLTATLIAALTSAGADAKNISTSSLNIQPTYTDGSNAITGYTVTENVDVTLNDLGKAGAVLDSAAKSVGDSVRVGQMTLSISDDSSLLATARTQAVADAKAKASAMASGAGVKLGTIKSISDDTSSSTQSLPYASSLAAGAASIPISPGQQQLAVSVSVVYNLDS